MQKTISLLFVVMVFILCGFSMRKSNTEFVCSKTLKAKNECHYNFLVDGGKFRYVDRGCKRKKEDVLKKVEAGEIPLAKDWTLECPMPKKDN